LFIEPRFTIEMSQVQDVILVIMYFAIAIFTGNLTARLRTKERQAQYNAERTMALYTLAHETATAVNMDDVLHTAVTQIGRVFDASIAILLPKEGKLDAQPHPASTLTFDEKDASVAAWVFANNKPAGKFTDMLPLASATYLPLRTPSRTVGVIGICTNDSQRYAYDQEVMLETFVTQVALTVERELLDEAGEQSMMMRESERLYTTLLNSISHELRTPIATIAGAASSLNDPATAAQPDVRAAMTQDIRDAADRLNRLVENLLDMSRLESGRLQLKREWCDLREIVAIAVTRFETCMTPRALTITHEPDLPLVEVDFVLLEQVIVNLLDNICHYTPPDTAVQIETRRRDSAVEIIVSDAGTGIPAEELNRIFDKFYRVPGTATGGTGLGLSICRGLVEAHGGTLAAANRLEGGARFTIRLPTNGAPPPVHEASL